jgi:hypothetical protein
MAFVELIALYLALYRYVNGPSARVTFPGTQKNYLYTFTGSSQDIIARPDIYLSVEKPDQANGEVFNTADTATRGSWSVKWPLLSKYFGLEGAGPGPQGWSGVDQWWKNEHQAGYKRMCKKYGLRRRVLSDTT